MRGRWRVVAALLFLTACRSGASGERGPGERRPPGDAATRGAAASERDATARTLAAMRVVGRSQIAMATLVEPRTQSSEVKEQAARSLEQQTENVDTLTRLAREKSIDLGAVERDPWIQADQAVGRDAIDRLARASGPELDALYLSFQAASAMRLSRLADQAEGLTRDPESAASVRRIATLARDAQARAFAALPHECGGLRGVTPAPPPRALPALEDPRGRADAGADAGERLDAGAGSSRPRGATSPSTIDL